MSEPIRMMNAEKRRVDETAKEFWVVFFKTTVSYGSASRSDDETQEWLTLSTLWIFLCCACSAQTGSPEMIITIFAQSSHNDKTK